MTSQNQGETSEAIRLKNFWDARYQEFSLRESGILRHSEECSQLLYACKSAAYRHAIVKSGIDPRQPTQILDIGCGQGFFARLAKSVFSAPQYTGVDISEKAIQYLRTEIPDFHWMLADASSSEFSVAGQFDFVQSIEVLHLILDDELHTRAIRNMARAMNHGGHLILTDTFPEQRTPVGEYIVFRPMTYYRRLFDELSMEVVNVFPMYYWMPDGGPMIRYLSRFVRALPMRMIYWLDRLLLRLGIPQGKQSHDCRMKMMVCRKSENV